MAKMHSFAIILFFTLFLTISSATYDKVCRDPQGNEVDWYVIFLFPQKIDPANILSYAYIDDKHTELTYYAWDNAVFPPTQITNYSWSKSTNFNYFFWNDDVTCKDDTTSHGASSSKAHAKGSLVFDKESGAFLLHSLPRLPTRMTTGEILLELPSNAGVYAQHFLCVSVDEPTVYTIAELLNKVNVSINASVETDRVNKPVANEWINKLIINKYSTSYENKIETTITSLFKKQEFTFFSKSHRLGELPFDNSLREKYKSDFYVRTWSRPSLSPAVCEQYKIYNVLDLNYDDKYEFGKDKEHSKWAVAKDKDICCFGDMNHTESQKKEEGRLCVSKTPPCKYNEKGDSES